jgi:hypothetical protein
VKAVLVQGGIAIRGWRMPGLLRQPRGLTSARRGLCVPYGWVAHRPLIVLAYGKN